MAGILSKSDLELPSELATTVPNTVMPQTSLWEQDCSNVFFTKGELIWDNWGYILPSTHTSMVIHGSKLLIRKPFPINGFVSSLPVFKSRIGKWSWEEWWQNWFKKRMHVCHIKVTTKGYGWTEKSSASVLRMGRQAASVQVPAGESSLLLP